MTVEVARILAGAIMQVAKAIILAALIRAHDGDGWSAERARRLLTE